MDFQSAMETFAEAWVAANTTGKLTQMSSNSNSNNVSTSNNTTTTTSENNNQQQCNKNDTNNDNNGSSNDPASNCNGGNNGEIKDDSSSAGAAPGLLQGERETGSSSNILGSNPVARDEIGTTAKEQKHQHQLAGLAITTASTSQSRSTGIDLSKRRLSTGVLSAPLASSRTGGGCGGGSVAVAMGHNQRQNHNIHDERHAGPPPALTTPFGGLLQHYQQSPAMAVPATSPAASCLGKSIPIHCIVEVRLIDSTNLHRPRRQVRRSKDRSQSNPRNVDNNRFLNNNTWEYGKHLHQPQVQVNLALAAADEEESVDEVAARKPQDRERMRKKDEDEPPNTVVELSTREGNQAKDKEPKTATDTMEERSSSDKKISPVHDEDKPMEQEGEPLLMSTSEGEDEPHEINGKVDDTEEVQETSKTTIEVDDFVIIPSGTMFQDVIPAVLAMLGYSKDDILNAEGTIGLRNWKPLRLDQICDCPQKTVGDIFNDLTNHATLRILVTRSKGETFISTTSTSSEGRLPSTAAAAVTSGDLSLSSEDLKEKLLRLLLRQSSSFLFGPAGRNTTTTSTSANIFDEVASEKPGLEDRTQQQLIFEEVSKRFDLWYSAQHQQTINAILQSLVGQQALEHGDSGEIGSGSHGQGHSFDSPLSSSSSSSSTTSSIGAESPATAADCCDSNQQPNSSPKTSEVNSTINASPSSSCPLNGTKRSLVQSHLSKELPSEDRHQLNRYQQQQQQQQQCSPNKHLSTLLQHHHQKQQQQQQLPPPPKFFFDECTNELFAAAAAAAGAGAPHHHLLPGPTTGTGAMAGDASGNHHRHPVFHSFASQKTRMRTSFDPEMELPKLQQWFADNPHPSRQQIQQYVKDLNLLDCRKDRKPLDVNNVIYWFKNARAAQKRNELRYNGISSSSGSHSGAGGSQGQAPTMVPFSLAHFHQQQQPGLYSSPFKGNNRLFHQQQRGDYSGDEEDGIPADSCGGTGFEERSDGEIGPQEGCRRKETRCDREFIKNRNSRQVEPAIAAALTPPPSDSRHIKEEFDDSCAPSEFVRVEVELSEGPALCNTENGRAFHDEQPKDLTNSRSDNQSQMKNETYETHSGLLVNGVDRFRKTSPEREFNDRRSNLSTTSPTASLSPRSPSPEGFSGLSPRHQAYTMFNNGDRRGESCVSSPPSPSLRHSQLSPPVSPNAAAAILGPYSSSAAATAAMLNRFHPLFDHPSLLAYHRHLNSFHFGNPNFPQLPTGSPGPDAHISAAAGLDSSTAARKTSAPGFPSASRERTSSDHLFPDFSLIGNHLRSSSASSHGGTGGRPSPYNPFGPPSTPSSASNSSVASHRQAELISTLINSSARHELMAAAGLGSAHRNELHPHHNHFHHHRNSNNNSSSGTGRGGVAANSGSTLGLVPGGGGGGPVSPTSVLSAALQDERRKRNRTFIDPVTEVPRLEQWFSLNTHPSHNLILKYTDELNRMPYRQKFPRLEPKNVQFWFKNRRAKCKRLKMTM